MKELNTKVGVFLTTYTQSEIDDKLAKSLEEDKSYNCDLFMKDIKTFNPELECCLTIKEARNLAGLEVKKSKKNPQNLYTNYKGNPFGLPVEEAKLYYTSPISSLKSAFEIAAPEFDFDKDFFHIKIIK